MKEQIQITLIENDKDKDSEILENLLKHHVFYILIVKTLSEIKEKGFGESHVAILLNQELTEVIELKEKFPEVSFIMMTKDNPVISVMNEMGNNHIECLFFQDPVQQRIHELFDLVDRAAHN
jgi:hypothetical protein